MASNKNRSSIGDGGRDKARAGASSRLKRRRNQGLIAVKLRVRKDSKGVGMGYGSVRCRLAGKPKGGDTKHVSMTSDFPFHHTKWSRVLLNTVLSWEFPQTGPKSAPAKPGRKLANPRYVI